MAGLLVVAGYCRWAYRFIYDSAVVGLDGQRYHALFDDAMISMRYAWNLAHGDGLVWNPGDGVEGITNTLWALLMAVPAAFLDRSAACLAVQVMGAVLVLVAALCAMGIGDVIMREREVPGRRLLNVIVLGAGLAYYPLNFWSLMGIETGLLSALLLGGAYVSVRGYGERSVLPLLPVLLGLACWTRPDAAVPAGLIVLHRLNGLVRARPPESPWRPVVRTAATEVLVLAGFVVGIALFRLAYYGSWVPNTYYLKVEGLDFWVRLKNGWLFVRQYLPTVSTGLAFVSLAVLVSWNRHAVLALSLFGASIIYQMWAGGDPWLYWRQMAATTPLFFMLCVVEMATLGWMLIRKVYRPGSRPPVWRLVLLALLTICWVGRDANLAFWEELSFEKPMYTHSANEKHVRVGQALAEITDEDARIGVLWAGVIPYYSGRRAIDYLGKSDAYIASLGPETPPVVSFNGMPTVPGHNKYDLEYSIKTLKPTYTQSTRWGSDDVTRYVRKHYRRVSFQGQRLWLRRKSDDVHWERMR